MKYRLNLYTERFRPTRILLNRWALAAGVALPALLVGLIGIGLEQSNRDLAQRHRELAMQQEQLKSRMQELTKQLEANRENSKLQEAIATQSREIASKRRMLEHLSANPLLTQARYSRFMHDLSNSHVQGLWLTRVQADGKNLILDGRSLSEELLPRWLQRLSTQADFRGKTFGVLEMTRPEHTHRPHLDFHLSTQLKQKEGDNG